MCVLPRRYDFVVKVIKNGREKSKIVWSAYNGYRMSQENVIKWRVVLHLSFPNSYSV